MAEMYAEDISTEDRRRVVAAEVIRGREANVANWRAIVGIDADNLTSTTIATRGNRLASQSHAFPGISEPKCSTSSRSTPTTGSRRSSYSTPTTSTLPSMNSTPATSPAGSGRIRADLVSLANTYAEFNRNDYASVVNVDHRKGVRYAPGELTTANMKGLMPNLRATSRSCIDSPISE